MIKAIIFDCFGVLTSDGWIEFCGAYFGDNAPLLDKAKSLDEQANAGRMSYTEFISQAARMANIDASTAMSEIDKTTPNERLFRYISEHLKEDYKIGILSNAAENWLPELFQPEQIQLFDAVALSYEIRAVKPDPQSYQIIASRLNVDTNECVFIDDQQRYCDGAMLAGMAAIRYVDFDQTIHDLNGILGV